MWLAVWVSLVVFATLTSISLAYKYFYSAITYDVEVDYTNWNSSLPAVSYCSIGVEWNDR